MRVALAALLLLLAAPAQAASDHVWVTDAVELCGSGPDTGAVYMANPSTHVITPLTSGGFLRKPLGIAASPDGSTVWVVDANAFDPTPPTDGSCDNGNGGVIAIDTATGQQTAVSGNGVGAWTDPYGIAYDPAHGRLIVSDPGVPMVYSVDPSTGAQTQLTLGGFMVHPEGVAVASDGTVYVADPDANSGSGAIWQITPTGGSPDPPAAVATGPDMADPHDLAWAGNGHLMVVDAAAGEGAPALLDVLPNVAAPGSASHRAGPTPTSGPVFCGAGGITETPFTSPRGIASASNGTDFYVLDGSADPQWCMGFAETGVLFGVTSSAAATWAAGLTAGTPWVTAEGATLATKNRLPVPVIGVPASEVPAAQAFTVDASHSVDPDGDALSYSFDLDGNGTFETPADASGRASVSFPSGGDHPIGVQVDDGNGGITSTGTTVHVAAAPAPPVDPAPVVDQPNPTPPDNQQPAFVETTTPTTPATVTVTQLLSSKGIVVPLTCTADCTVQGILQILQKDLKSLTAANKVITIGTGTIVLKAGKKGVLRIKLTKEARKRLKKALAGAHISARRKIVLNLTMQSKYKSGTKKRIRRKIILKG